MSTFLEEGWAIDPIMQHMLLLKRLAAVAGSSAGPSSVSAASSASAPRTRKRARKPEKWRKNVRKKLRNTGQEYVSSSNKRVSVYLILRYLPEDQSKIV